MIINQQIQKIKYLILPVLFFVILFGICNPTNIYAYTEKDVGGSMPFSQLQAIGLDTKVSGTEAKAFFDTYYVNNASNWTKDNKDLAAIIKGLNDAANKAEKAEEETAKKDETKDDYPSKIDKWYERWAYDKVKACFDNPATSDIQKIAVGPTFKNTVNGLKTYYDGIKSVGYAFVILYFLLDLIDKTSRDNFNIEHFFRMVLKLILAKIIIENGWNMINSIVDIGNGVFSDLTLSYNNNTANAEKALASFATQIQDSKMTEDILIGMSFMIPQVLLWLAKIITSTICITRIVEFGIRAMFFPIGAADVFTEGMRGGGFRYIKKMIAVAIQGAVIIGTLVILQTAQTAVLSSAGSNATQLIWYQVVIGFTSVAVVMKSQGWANDIIGV